MCSSLLQDIAQAWKGLEAGEKEKQEFLQNDLIRLERLEHLAATFERKASMLEKWAAGQDAPLKNNEDITAADLPEANVGLVSSAQLLQRTECVVMQHHFPFRPC